MRLVALVVVGMSLVSGVAHASPAEDLGRAYKAYDDNDLGGAKAALATLEDDKLVCKDYALWLRGMVALRSGDAEAADAAFKELGLTGAGKFGKELPWRRADVLWLKGDKAGAAAAYAKLITVEDAGDRGDVGTAKFRIAQTKSGAAEIKAYRAVVIDHPAHPLAERAMQKLVELGAGSFTIEDHIERAKQLQAAHLWDEAVVEIQALPAKLSKEQQKQRDYWLGTTFFKMRRRYADAGTLLLGVYKDMGKSADEAMFHGARALSRADRDDEAITWYKKVVATYPSSAYAEEAQFLSGWLEFNRGNYAAAVEPLQRVLTKYKKSKWVDDSLWYLGMAHYLSGDFSRAKENWTQLAKHGGSLEGGKGMYWLARIAERMNDKQGALDGYQQTVQRYPFSWYALLAQARSNALGTKLPVFGVAQPKMKGAKLPASVDGSLANDMAIRRADELSAAGLGVDASEELVRNERSFLKAHPNGGLAFLMDRYRKAGNFNRPWAIASSYSGGALDGLPDGDARRWWENAYPRAFKDLVDKYAPIGKNPEGYLYSIMRKESGFDQHVVSYADAQGLLQMIPPTTQRVSKAIGIPYDAGNLYETDYNIHVGAWYIGHLLQKFKGQIPLGAGSFNSGPRPVMKWIDRFGDREMDEMVELVPFSQTREYMKKVTENFARYQYLYENKVYVQPLTVDKSYLDDRLTY
ncbi:hypothetical protein BH11MYX2_BH11MYX2_13800 [soil metagenome]